MDRMAASTALPRSLAARSAPRSVAFRSVPLTAVPVMLRVAAINPRSQNIDQAIRYLENYVASLPDAAKAAMMPDMNDPILNPIFEQEMAQMQATADAYKKALETADAAADMGTVEIARQEPRIGRQAAPDAAGKPINKQNRRA